MEKFVKGDIVVIPFPFSDLTSQKRRPALVISTPTGNDLMVCQITSRFHNDNYSIEINESDIIDSSLNQLSYIRPNKLISIDKKIILYRIGSLNGELLEKTIDKIIEIIRS